MKRGNLSRNNTLLRIRLYLCWHINNRPWRPHWPHRRLYTKTHHRRRPHRPTVRTAL